jgi:hypothetical protein
MCGLMFVSFIFVHICFNTVENVFQDLETRFRLLESALGLPTKENSRQRDAPRKVHAYFLSRLLFFDHVQSTKPLYKCLHAGPNTVFNSDWSSTAHL